MQFWTTGLYAICSGTLTYYSCTTLGDCDGVHLAGGPGAALAQQVVFFTQSVSFGLMVLLAWLAIDLAHSALPKGGTVHVGRRLVGDTISIQFAGANSKRRRAVVRSFDPRTNLHTIEVRRAGFDVNLRGRHVRVKAHDDEHRAHDGAHAHKIARRAREAAAISAAEDGFAEQGVADVDDVAALQAARPHPFEMLRERSSLFRDAVPETAVVTAFDAACACADAAPHAAPVAPASDDGDAQPHEEREATVTLDLTNDEISYFPLRSAAASGLFRKLLKYDVVAFALIVGALVALHLWAWLDGRLTHAWQWREGLYWARAFFALSSFPYLFFSIPVLNRILTHARPTGYDRAGRCVAKLERPWEHKHDADGKSHGEKAGGSMGSSPMHQTNSQPHHRQ